MEIVRPKGRCFSIGHHVSSRDHEKYAKKASIRHWKKRYGVKSYTPF